MELDVFKTAWKQLEVTKEAGPTKQAIFEAIKRRTALTVGTMRRNLVLEVVAVIILYGTSTVFFLLEFENRFWPVSAFMFLTGVFYLIYLKKKNQLLVKLYSPASNVKFNLHDQLQTLQQYTRFYIMAGTVQFPTTILFLVIVFVSRAAITPLSTSRLSSFLASVEGLAAVSSSFIVLIVCGYYLNRWYVHRLYGKHLEHLRKVVTELKEDLDHT